MELSKIIRNLFLFHIAALNVAKRSISEMVNEKDDIKRSQRIEHWRVAMLTQLSNVEIIGAIMTAAIVGAFTWPALTNLSVLAFTLIQILWYSSLVLAVGAVALGLQQSIFLARIGCLSDANDICRRMLSFDDGSGRSNAYKPRWDQVLIWQAAVGLLEWSIYTWLAGFTVFIWDLTKMGRQHPGKSNQVSGFCLSAFIATLILYLLSTLRLWYMVKSP